MPSKLRVCAARFLRSPERAITLIRIDTATKSNPIKAAAAAPVTWAKLSQPSTMLFNGRCKSFERHRFLLCHAALSCHPRCTRGAIAAADDGVDELYLELWAIGGPALPRALWMARVSDGLPPCLASHDVPHVCVGDSEY